MRVFVVGLVFMLSGCTPRLSIVVRDPAVTSLGSIKRLSILTHDTRLGQVLRERVRFELAKDAHFTLVPVCGARSCESVDGFVRLYEREPSVDAAGVTVTVETSVMFADGRAALEPKLVVRKEPLTGEPFDKAVERVSLDIAATFARTLVHPTHVEWLELDDAATFKLGNTQALDGRLGDARRTFETMLENNPRTAGACFNLALLFELLDEPQLARERFDCAVSLSSKPEYRSAQSAFEARQRAREKLSR